MFVFLLAMQQCYINPFGFKTIIFFTALLKLAIDGLNLVWFCRDWLRFELCMDMLVVPKSIYID